jgi:hypothetical protein
MQEKTLLGESERKGYEKKLEDWRTEGFDVSRLAGVLRNEPGEAPGAFETAEKGVSRNRELRREWEELRLPEAGDGPERLRRLLADPWTSGEAENLLLELQVQHEKQKKEDQRRERDRERRTARLREKVAAWKKEGYATGPLEAALEKGAEAAEAEMAVFEEGLARLGALAEELRGLETPGFEEDRKKIEGMLHDPARAQEAEDALIHLRIRAEKARKAQRARAEQEKREREALRSRAHGWREAGLKIPLADDLIENAPLDELNDRFEELEEQMVRMDELRDELGRMELSGLEAERKALEEMMRDPALVQATEERLLRLQLTTQRAARERERKAEESRRWRHDLQVRVAELKGAGYDTTRIGEAFARDDEGLRLEWVKFRMLLKKSQELESELRALPQEGFEKEAGELLSRLRRLDLESIEDVQYGIRSIGARMAARREQELRQREEQKREKEELTGRLMKWVGEGYRDGTGVELEKMVSYALPRLRSEVASLAERIARVEALRKEMLALNISGFEVEAAAVLDELYDLSRVAGLEPQISELRQRITAKRDEEKRLSQEEARRRSEFRSKVAGWKRLGFNVSTLEEYLEGDMEFLRKEYALARMRIQKAQGLLGDLAALPEEPEDEGAEREKLRRAIQSLDGLDECAGRVERLRMNSAERARQRKKLDELRKKAEDWKAQGYDVSRLERLSGQDVESQAKEFLMFKIAVQKLRELEEELRLLDTGGFEAERSAIEALLHDVDAVGEIRDRLSALELEIGRRMASEVRLQEERRRLQGEFISRMSAWLEEGIYVDQLEGALGKDPQEMASEFARFEDAVKESRELRERLEEFSGAGYDDIIARIREKLRDVGHLEEAKREIHELWEKIERRRKEADGRRKEEDELRFNIVKQMEAWEAMGYDVSGLERLAGGRLEELRRGMINFRMRIERMQGLLGILDAIDIRGFEPEAASIRALLKDIERAEEVEAALSALKQKVHERKEAERTAKERMHKLRDACTDRFLAMLSAGYNVDTLEGVLELPYEELSLECGRLEGVVARLGEIEAEVRRRGLAAGNEAMLARLHDVNALAELEEWLSSGKAPEEARQAPDRPQVIRFGAGAAAKAPAEPPKAPGEAGPVPMAPAPVKGAEAPLGAGPMPPASIESGRAPAPGPARTAPSLAAAVAGAGPAESLPEEEAPRPAEPFAERPTCQGCGEAVDPLWRRCPSCLRPLVSVEEEAAPPAPAKPAPSAPAPAAPAAPAAPSPPATPPAAAPAAPAPAAPHPAAARYERIAARPEKDMGIRDESHPEKKERGRRESALNPEKLAALRAMIAEEREKGVDVGDIEVYLDSGVVTKEGLRIRLEAINEQSKRLDGLKAAAPAQAAPGTPPAGGPETEAAPSGEAPAGPQSGESPDAEQNGEPAGAGNGPPGEGVRKLKKVKKVVK